MGGLLVTFDHALLGQHPGQSGMLVVHLALRPLSAFGLDDRAKVSACTSGADPRSTGPTTLSSPMGAPAPAPGALRSRCRSAELRVKRTHNFALYGRRRPGKTAIRTALPRRLLTRKRTEVQLLPRPPHPSDVHFPNSCMPHLSQGQSNGVMPILRSPSSDA